MRWFALEHTGKIVPLGDHGGYDEADDYAQRVLNIKPVWLLDEENYTQWMVGRVDGVEYYTTLPETFTKVLDTNLPAKGPAVDRAYRDALESMSLSLLNLGVKANVIEAAVLTALDAYSNNKL